MENGRVRVALAGLGNIGAGTHIKYLPTLPKAHIVGVCDIIKEKADAHAAAVGAAAYYDAADMLDKAKPDMIIIAVPHYDHTTIALEAFKRGVSVLSEKPVAVHVNDAKKMINAHEDARKLHPYVQFGVMFQERLQPYHVKLKDIIDSGELGKLVRVTLINTRWYRTQAYYNSGGWRATWKGEGGGVLLNQCPHTLDTYQWLFGAPSSIQGTANIARYHDIEVEDDVTAVFEHDNGMTAQFIVSTGETPGTDRLEIIGEYGRVVLEEGQLSFLRNRQSMFEHCKTWPGGFDRAECWPTVIPVDSTLPYGHKFVTERFIDRLLDGTTELVAYGHEGLPSVMMANAIMLSSHEHRRIDLPMDGDAWEAELMNRIKHSTFVK